MSRKPVAVKSAKSNCLQCPLKNHCHKSFGPIHPITSRPAGGPPTPHMASLSQVAYSIFVMTKGRVRVTPVEVALSARRMGLYNKTDQRRTRITLVGRCWKRQQTAILLKDAPGLRKVLIAEQAV